VFVSSDRDQTSFDEYYGSMTFDALPFSARDLKTALGEKYGVKGIPTLVLLDGAGELVDANIRGKHADYL
jgi:nucleoredoxin